MVIDDSFTVRKPSSSPEIAAAIKAAGLASAPLARAPTAAATGAGSPKANVEQQDWFVNVAIKVLLPLQGRRKALRHVFWSKDPDGTQHGQDSLNKLVPGQRADLDGGIRNASNDLRPARRP